VQIAMSGKSIEIINTDAEAAWFWPMACSMPGRWAALTSSTLPRLPAHALSHWAMPMPAFSPMTKTHTSIFTTALKRQEKSSGDCRSTRNTLTRSASNIADIMNTGGRWAAPAPLPSS